MSRPHATAAALLATAAATVALAAPAAAQEAETAQTPPATTPTAPPPPPEPKPAPKAGKTSIDVDGGLMTSKLRYVARGGVIDITGTARPYVPGQLAVLVVRRAGKVVGRKRVKIKRGRRGTGRIEFAYKARAKGLHRAKIIHRATPRQRAFESKAVRFKSITASANAGERGTKVLLLQRGLKKLGYAVGVTGYYDDGTSRAVIAFRKVNEMDRIGYASPTVYSQILQGKGAFQPRYPNAGYHIEYDWSKQALAFVRDGKPYRVYHSSSGAPATPTVFGTFTFYRKEPGTNSLGMVHSNYFIRGYAIHGYKSVPTYPASHG
ncbi:MAG: murein L,D-transpeptidase, partial [Solirubrobacterales bacterium]|nr:murein L,D-transpeptidase [Solirubrobacterales bacterium]